MICELLERAVNTMCASRNYRYYTYFYDYVIENSKFVCLIDMNDRITRLAFRGTTPIVKALESTLKEDLCSQK